MDSSSLPAVSAVANRPPQTHGEPSVRIFRRQAPISVLGPGERAVIWVQGCPFACPGCIVPESWDPAAGESVAVAELAEWVLSLPGIEGVTLSGGEPMAQAYALCALIDAVRAKRSLGVVCYTGYRYEHLAGVGDAALRELLARIDLLIDGAYLKARHASLLWRGSANQRLLPLTDRYREECGALSSEQSLSAGVEFILNSRGALAFAGVPPAPGFREEFAARMAQFGIALETEGEETP